MNESTLYQRDYSAVWVATCPSRECSARYGPDKFTCLNCDGRLTYFRELHGIQRSEPGGGTGSVGWTDCGLVCLNCGLRYKQLICERDETVITTPCISAYMTVPRPFFKKLIVGAIAFFVSSAVFLQLCIALKMDEDPAKATTGMGAIGATVLALWLTKPKKRWVSYRR